jgi:2-phosphosulfolactate phosphatase
MHKAIRIDVLFTPRELGDRGLTGRAVAVIDVLRATSTIVEAMANGARAVLPAGDMDDAMRLAQTIGRSEVLLCGERRSRKIEGFDLGNSPSEFTSEAVADKLVIMTTTNGTPALLAGASADRCVVAAYLNMSAAVADLIGAGKPIALLCAGRGGRFSLDDAICAGSVVRSIRQKLGQKVRMNDSARAALALERRYRSQLNAVISRTSAGRQLLEAGYGDDIAFCLTRDRHDVVPVMADRQVLRAV